jgi:hypothetical protein
LTETAPVMGLACQWDWPSNSLTLWQRKLLEPETAITEAEIMKGVAASVRVPLPKISEPWLRNCMLFVVVKYERTQTVAISWDSGSHDVQNCIAVLWLIAASDYAGITYVSKEPADYIFKVVYANVSKTPDPNFFRIMIAWRWIQNIPGIHLPAYTLP